MESCKRQLKVNAEIDSAPIFQKFVEYSVLYFDGILHRSAVKLEWSNRMTRCAGVAYFHKEGNCTIRLSKQLLKYRSLKELEETLLHEMIHAYLFLTKEQTYDDYINEGHGQVRILYIQAFLLKMNEINKEEGCNISVYHNFQEEVKSYQNHIWECDVKFIRNLLGSM